MNFIIDVFIRVLEHHKLNFESKILDDGTYQIDFIDLPIELDMHLCKAEFEKDFKIDKEYTRCVVRCCVPIQNGKSRSIRVVLDRDTYAEKLNAIDPIIRAFISKQYEIRV